MSGERTDRPDPAALSLEGLPPDARERLGELSSDGGAAPLFTSDLSVNEFMLIKEAGFHPRGLVFGSSIFNVGISKRNWWKNQEMVSLHPGDVLGP